MRKGFTLVELLITMVLVAVLATVALTQYTTTLERGRAAQAITILRDISDTWNAQYILNNNAYPAISEFNYDTFRTNYFSNPTLTLTGTTATVSVTRSGNNGYTLTATNTEGELTEITCSGGATGDCSKIGMTLKNNKYVLE